MKKTEEIYLVLKENIALTFVQQIQAAEKLTFF